MFKLIPMKPMDITNAPKNEEGHFNPFCIDYFCMGENFSKNIMYMFRSHNTEKYTYGYFVNTLTGERQQLIEVEENMSLRELDKDTVIVSIRCIVCGKAFDIHVKEQDYKDWKGGKLIQHAMPYLDVNERELMISKMCNRCFDEMISG